MPFSFSSDFLLFVESETPVPARVASQRRERPSFFNGDQYSSETAEAPPVDRRARSARMTPSNYAQKTLLPGARSSPRLSGRTFPASSFTATPQRTGRSPTHQTRSLRAQPTWFPLATSRCAITCTISPRAARTSPKVACRLALPFVPRGPLHICTHQRQLSILASTFDMPLVESQHRTVHTSVDGARPTFEGPPWTAGPALE